MLLFSTLLDINDTMTKEKFAELLFEWNQNSYYEENIIPDAYFREKFTDFFGNDQVWMRFEEYRDQNIVAVRYEKKNQDGVTWDTDYVMNFNEMKMAIRLERTYSRDAKNMDPIFSTPFFITYLIKEGYIKSDGGLPVSNKSIEVDEENIQLLVDVINGKTTYQLPIVYVSKTKENENPVDVKNLSSRLKGIAHVLEQKDESTTERIQNATDGNAEYDGAIGIYDPNPAVGHKRYLHQINGEKDAYQLEKVIRNVIEQGNSYQLDMLYTWQGVNNEILRAKWESQKAKREQAELESSEFIAAFDEEMEQLKQRMEELTRANEALQYENQGLRTRFHGLEAGTEPVLYIGREKELYDGEIKDYILSVIEEQLSKSKENTRKYDVLKDILHSNQYEKTGKKRRETIKRLLKNYKGMDAKLRQELIQLGFKITEDGKHYKLTYYGDERYQTVVGKTPSDVRAGKNNASIIANTMF